MTSVEALELYRRYAPDLDESTVRKIGYEVARWNRITKTDRLDEITLTTFAEFRCRAKEKGLAPKTIETNIDTIHLLFSTASMMGAIDAEPPPKGRRLKLKEPAPKPVSLEEINSLCSVLSCATWPVVQNRREWWRSWFCAAIWTGLRLSDITWTLGPEHFCEDRIEFSAHKTGKPHVFPLCQYVHRDLYFLHNRCGRSPHILRRQLREFCQKAGVRIITPKMFRQAAVTMWSMTSGDAGKLIHGCGIPRVMSHYQDRLTILNHAAPHFPWPEALTTPYSGFRQLTLF